MELNEEPAHDIAMVEKFYIALHEVSIEQQEEHDKDPTVIESDYQRRIMNLRS